MAITFRNLKDEAITHPEMDTNLASYYLSSSVSGSTITFFQSGSDGLVVSSSHTLTDLTGSDTTYIAGLGLDLDTGSNAFYFQNGPNLSNDSLTKWNTASGQLENSIVSDNGIEATVQGKANIIGDIYQSGSKVELNVAWPPTGTETHLLKTDGYEINGKPYQYSAIAMDHFEEFPGYFHNSFRIYTQDSEAFNYGSYFNVGPIRTGMFLKPSGSAELANISVQDNESGSSIALMYGTVVEIGVFNGEFINIGNAQSANTIQGLQTEITGSVLVSGSITADSFITRGGTSTQFVKGDGTLDSNTYLTSSTDTTYTASGSGLILSGTVFTNTLPDQTVTLVGQDITVNGTYPNFQLTGSATGNDALITLSASNGIVGGGSFTTDQATPDTISFTLTPGVVSGSSQITLQDTTGNLSGSRIDGAVALATNANTASYVMGNNVHGPVASAVTAVSASYAVTASHALNLKDGIDVVINSGSFNYITATTASFGFINYVTGSATLIGDAFVVVNSNTPSQRYSGLATYDSGSTNVTASFFFDSITNDWNYEYDNMGAVDYGVAMFGPEYTVQGTPVYNTNNRLVKADGGHHLLDSNISDNGTTVQVYSNIIITGSVSGSTYYGDGSNLTGITSTDITSLNSKSGSWDTAVTWGDHSLAGYLTSYSETDTLQTVTTRGATTTTTITAANFITTSDRRLKSDIEPLKDGLDTIKKFVSYEYTKGGVQDAGFMAQEVQEAIPYAIAEGGDGFLTMRDRPVLAYMHKAILELEARLAAIEEKLN